MEVVDCVPLLSVDLFFYSNIMATFKIRIFICRFDVEFRNHVDHIRMVRTSKPRMNYIYG